MSLLFTESFDIYGSLNDLAVKWFDRQSFFYGVGGGAGGGITITPGRFGYYGMHIIAHGGSIGFGQGSVQQVAASLGGDYSTIFLGIAYMWNAGTGHQHIGFYDANYSTIQLGLAVTGTQIYLYGTTTYLTSPQSVVAGQWNYVEIALHVSATVGWVELYLNGIFSAAYYGTGTSRLTANGNTMNSSLPSVRYVKLGAATGPDDNASQDMEFDDMYACNDAGSANNDILGDCRVMALLPNGTGGHTQFDRQGISPQPNNYTYVNEQVNDGDATFVSANSIGQEDTYTYADLPITANVIKAVVAQYVAKKDSGGARALQAIYRSGGTDGLSAGQANLSGSYTEAQLVMETNPLTGVPFTASDVNGGEFGFRVSA